MGMFDSFIMKNEVRCPKCGNKIGPEFQSKDVRNSLNVYTQGEHAVEWKYRYETEDERKEKITRFRLEHPNWFDETGKIFERFKLMECAGCFKKTNEVASVIGDGEYIAYVFCKTCEKLVYIDMIIYKGIFLGIRGLNDSVFNRLKARLKVKGTKIRKAVNSGPSIRMER